RAGPPGDRTPDWPHRVGRTGRAGTNPPDAGITHPRIHATARRHGMLAQLPGAIGGLMRRGLPALFLIAGLCFGDALSEALRSHRYEEVLAQTSAALKTNPRDPRLWTARGLALSGLGRSQESISSFASALEASPDYVPALKGAVQVAYRARDP